MLLKGSLAVDVILVLVATKYAASSILNCYPRKFSLFASCQRTCRGKPTICLVRPRCVCPQGVWDPFQKACVPKDECDPRNSWKHGGSQRSGGISGSGSISVSANGGGLIATFGKLFALPLKIFEDLLSLAYKLGIKPPLIIGKDFAGTVKTVIESVAKLDGKLFESLTKTIKQILSKVVETLVDAGVFQGKTFESFLNLGVNVVERSIKFVVGSEQLITSRINAFISSILDRIKDIRNWILGLPILKEITNIFLDFRSYILSNFQTQIDELRNETRKIYDEHRDFFQPISDGIASRFLIIINALNALIDGNVNECLGNAGPDQSPTGSLQRRLHIIILEIKIFIEKSAGFKTRAEEDEAKLDEEKAGYTTNKPGNTGNRGDGDSHGSSAYTKYPIGGTSSAKTHSNQGWASGGIGGSISGNGTIVLSGQK